jgi:hypothetical protein
MWKFFHNIEKFPYHFKTSYNRLYDFYGQMKEKVSDVEEWLKANVDEYEIIYDTKQQTSEMMVVTIKILNKKDAVKFKLTFN